jgi:hypothetical protein
VGDPDEVDAFGLRCFIHTPDLRRFDGPGKEDADLQVFLPGAREEVARLPRKHDRVMRRVDALFAELRGRFTQALPRLAQLFR